MPNGTEPLRTEVFSFEIGPENAPCLIFCHGMGLDHRDLLTLAASFANDWRVVLWDMPGHGRSGPLTESYTVDRLTDSLEEVLDRHGLDEPVVVGFSFGGMIAQTLIKRASRPVRGLICYGCFAPYLVESHVPDAEVAILADMIGSAPWSDVRAAFASACCISQPAQHSLYPALDCAGPGVLRAMTEALFASFKPDAAFEIALPTLILRGRLDANGAPLMQSAAALFDAATGYRDEQIIEDAGHCAHLDAPRATERAISQFLLTLGSGSIDMR